MPLKITVHDWDGFNVKSLTLEDPDGISPTDLRRVRLGTISRAVSQRHHVPHVFEGEPWIRPK